MPRPTRRTGKGGQAAANEPTVESDDDDELLPAAVEVVVEHRHGRLSPCSSAV